MTQYQFDRFKIDPQTVRLLKNDSPLKLEPLSFETLLYLVENRNRVITKDELLEKVWQGRVLTEHVITRIIYQLRKVLDDSDNKESCIRTVRGKGYQFIADVEEVDTEKAHVPARLTTQQLHYKNWILGLVVIVLITTTVWMFYKPTKEVVKNKKYQSIAVLPLKNSGSTDELTIFSASVVDYLTTQLSLNLNMKVIHPDSMSLLSNEFNDIWSIQQATGADYLLEGKLIKTSNDRIVIQLHLYEAENSELLPYDLGGFEFPYPRTTADLNQLYHKQRITIRDIIQLIKPGVSPLENGQVQTADPEAYRMIIRAHHLMRSDSCEGIYQAEMLQKQATERDPNYAYAWLQLLVNYFKRVWICGESTENYQRALAVAEKIEQLAPGQYEAVEIARNAILVETNHVEEAFEWAKDASWDNPAALSRKIYALRFAGFLKLARIHVDRILQLDPFFYNEKPIHQAPNTVLYLNDFDTHLSLLAPPGNAYHDYYRGLNLLLSSQTELANEVLSNTIERTPDDLFGRFSKALWLILEDQKQQAIGILDQIEANRVAMKHSDGEMTYKIVQLYALSGAIDQALSLFSRSIDQGFFPVTYFMTDPAIEALRNHADFEILLDKARTRHLAFAQRFNLNPEITNK